MRLTGTVYAKTLEMDTGISIVTPDHFQSKEPYKVAYLLHGLCGSSRTWLEYSMLPVYAGKGNTVYVMPEVGRSFYMDMEYGFRYFTYVTEELPAICKDIFRISAEREDTAIIGGSMGGYGALRCALSRPGQYGMCAAFSSGCLFLKEGIEELKANGMRQEYVEHFGQQLSRDFVAAFGESYEWKPEYEITELAARAKKQGVVPKLFLTCGTSDYFYQDYKRICQKFEALGVSFTAEEWEAQHDFPYFNDALKKAVERFGL